MPIRRLQGYTALDQRAIDPSLRLFIATGDPRHPERELAFAEALGLVEHESNRVPGIYTWWTPPEEARVRD